MTAATARAAARERFSGWEDAARANFESAEEFCRGDDNMLNARGKARGMSAWDLWHGSEERAREFASDDLLVFWDWHAPRPPGPRDYVNGTTPPSEDEGEDAMTTREQVEQYRSEPPPVVMEAYERNLATVRAAAGLDAPSVPAGLRAPEGRGVAVAQPESAVQPRAAGTLERAQPPREPIDGAKLLTGVCKWLKRYLYLDSDAKYWALTLWIAGSHFRDKAGLLVHETYPIAGFLSDEPGSGKTHALDLLAILCPEVPGVLVEPSEAAVAALVGKEHVTLLLDEADVLFGTGARKSAIRALLNSGYRQGGIWPRVRKNVVDRTPAYGAKALAGLKTMKTGTGSSLEALMTRILEFEMRKPPAGTRMHKLRERFGTDIHGTPITGRTIGAHLNGQMADWAAQEFAALAAALPQIPEGVELREEDKWLPIINVGARAEVNRQAREDEDKRTEGDDWAELAWQACVDMSLYGGAPDTAEAQAATVAGIIDGWED